MKRALDRRIQFQRYTKTDDGYSKVKVWADHGVPLWAEKTDISDAERLRAAQLSAQITTRFLVPWSTFTRDLTPKDRLKCEGLTYDISGIKEGAGRRCWLELTCAAVVDL